MRLLHFGSILSLIGSWEKYIFLHIYYQIGCFNFYDVMIALMLSGGRTRNMAFIAVLPFISNAVGSSPVSLLYGQFGHFNAHAPQI